MAVGTGLLEGRRTFARRIGKGSVAMVLAAALLVGGTYLWQHAQVIDGKAALDRAASAGQSARAQVSALEGRNHSLRQEVAALKDTAAKPESPAKPATLLADGTYPTFVRTVDVENATVTVDVIQVFEHQAAIQAAIEDGMRRADAQYLDVYVRNHNDLLRTIPVAPDVRIDFMGECDSPGSRTQALRELAKATTPFTTTYYYAVTVAGGAIDRIEQHIAISAC
jgi:outer membrane murein-binding lipoprotein Lpp